MLNTYWQNQVSHLEGDDHDYKLHQLPLARIKKVMKADPEVKMISAEAPILFAKGCDMFITELTMRAWIHAEENKRRTLQRSDIASALAKSDMFDFLIDIVPREDATPQHKRRQEFTPSGTYAVPDAQIASTANTGMQQQPQQGQAAPAQQEASHQLSNTDFSNIPQHIAQEQYQTQTGMYPPPAPQTGYAQTHMFDPNAMYTGGYGMAQQTVSRAEQDERERIQLTSGYQMYSQGQRMTDPNMGADPGHHYRGPEDDTEGEREYDV